MTETAELLRQGHERAIRSRAIDDLIKSINGVGDQSDSRRRGHMTEAKAIETLDLFKAANSLHLTKVKDGVFDQYHGEMEKLSVGEGVLRKDVSIATGLVYYDLRAPAMNLFPTVTPLRNSIPRGSRANPGDALHYKRILSTTGSGFGYMGWVPEGQRTASMSYTSTPTTMPYATLGEEDSLTDEARIAAQGFEDENAMVQLRLLLKMFVKEEAAILAGNSSMTLATPGTPTSSAAGSGGTLPAILYSIYVVGLTQEGYLNSSLAGGVATTMAITGNDGRNYTLNGGSSALSPNKTQNVTSGQILSVGVAAIRGAVAYAWFVGAVGSETLQAITTINSATFSAALTAGQQAVSAITGDHSNNGANAFDGLMTWAFNSVNNAYYYSMPQGTLGTGTGLTSSGYGSVNEIDTMLKSMWDNYRVSPTVLYVNSQELKNITTKVLSNTTTPLLRYNVDVAADGMAEYKLTAGGVISFYFNPFTADGGIKIPVKIHPNLAAGTILAWCEKLPPWYVSNETPVVAQVFTRQDYTNEVWPRVTRQQYYGVYAQEAMAVFAPFAMGIITNIGNS